MNKNIFISHQTVVSKVNQSDTAATIHSHTHHHHLLTTQSRRLYAFYTGFTAIHSNACFPPSHNVT